MKAQRRRQIRAFCAMALWAVLNFALFTAWLLILDQSDGINDPTFAVSLAPLCLGMASTILWVFYLLDL